MSVKKFRTVLLETYVSARLSGSILTTRPLCCDSNICKIADFSSSSTANNNDTVVVGGLHQLVGAGIYKARLKKLGVLFGGEGADVIMFLEFERLGGGTRHCAVRIPRGRSGINFGGAPPRRTGWRRTASHRHPVVLGARARHWRGPSKAGPHSMTVARTDARSVRPAAPQGHRWRPGSGRRERQR